jgi:hypothetical protein
MALKHGRRGAYRINVGDRVRYRTVGGGFRAEVIEDRGHLGVGGRRMLQIRTLSEVEGAGVEFPVPEEELELME